jgi:soluble lytic murein transglycosylase
VLGRKAAQVHRQRSSVSTGPDAVDVAFLLHGARPQPSWSFEPMVRRDLVRLLPLLLLGAAAGPAPAADREVQELARGHQAFRRGDYRAAIRHLHGLAGRLTHTADYALYLEAESTFYEGGPAQARALFAELAGDRSSRLAGLAEWRTADCLWTEGQKKKAGETYGKLVTRPTPQGVDPAVAHFRLAELAPADRAPELFRKVYVEFPGHPLAERARWRAPPPAPVAADVASGPVAHPQERFRRAELFFQKRRFAESLQELEKLPADLPDALAVRRDLDTGVALYNMRNDYPRAARLLLEVAPRLSGEKAAFAAFHGARAMSRADRDDEAIRFYRQVVERYPASSWAAEAQFRAAWLEFVRGRYREAIVGLQATLQRYGRSAFADDAAWYLAFSHFLLGQAATGLPMLERSVALAPRSDQEAAKRALYWRGRFLAKMGRPAEAHAALEEGARRWPFHHYGILARARLSADGQAPPMPLAPSGRLPTLEQPPQVARDPVIEKLDELLAADMAPEAAVELRRQEGSFTRRQGKLATLGVLLDRYQRTGEFHRPFQLAESLGEQALQVVPEGNARRLWEAAYPQAFPEMVARHGPPAGNPDFLVHTIMRNETNYRPHLVSPADARGLLQLIPARGKEMAALLGIPFHEDQLLDAETNIRLGAHYLGLLVKTFRSQIPLVAAAYNAGAGAVMRWCDRYGQHPLDEFVELVVYDDTRRYVKHVLAIYARYHYLYRGQPYLPPLSVDRRYLRAYMEGPGRSGN